MRRTTKQAPPPRNAPIGDPRKVKYADVYGIPFADLEKLDAAIVAKRFLITSNARRQAIHQVTTYMKERDMTVEEMKAKIKHFRAIRVHNGEFVVRG